MEKFVITEATDFINFFDDRYWRMKLRDDIRARIPRTQRALFGGLSGTYKLHFGDQSTY
jgi:hypothetical protein